MPNSAGDTSWERIEANARLLGEGENPNRDCDIIREFFSYILTRWGKALNARDEATKRHGCASDFLSFLLIHKLK